MYALQGFDHHVKRDHNMWMYIYFSIYLDTIDISDHNAIEKYVYEMVSMSCRMHSCLLACNLCLLHLLFSD